MIRFTFKTLAVAVPLAVVASAGFAYRHTLASTLDDLSLKGKGSVCSWRQSAAAAWVDRDIRKEVIRLKSSFVIEAADPALGIEKIRTPERSFWISAAGAAMPGPHLLAYLLAEQRQLLRGNPGEYARRGDIVFDCGAHVGVYTHTVLRRGAAKVIAVEPEPVNLECLRRNFAEEIRQGRVVIIPKGVWDSNGSLEMHEGLENSGTSSLVRDQGGKSFKIDVVTIDTIAQELHLPRVDYIKMDIEGAERNALRGAEATLRRWHPRLMMDNYHRPDDSEVLPAIVRAAYSDYSQTCSFCEAEAGRIIPHVVFYH